MIHSGIIGCLQGGVLGTLLLVSSMQISAQKSSAAWMGTWAASPVSDGSGRSFHAQTLRQIVHCSVGGKAVRVHISNVFGTQHLRIENAHIAVRREGASIVEGTDRAITFGGAAQAVIPSGAMAVSDAVALTVAPLSDVAVSFYLPQTSGPATMHESGFQTNYVANGNVSGNPSLADFTTTESDYYLTNLDVQDKSNLGAVVTLGASITDGYSSEANANRRWPNDLAKRLQDAGLHVGVLNQGISGNRLLSDGAGVSAEARFQRDVLDQPGVRWVIFSDEPINDLGSASTPLSAQELIQGIERLIVRAHEHRVKFFCATLTPYQGAGYWKESGGKAREQINAYMRGPHSRCDAVVDADGATHDPIRPTWFLPTYDSGDHLHPNTAGLQAIADVFDFALISKTTSKTSRHN